MEVLVVSEEQLQVITGIPGPAGSPGVPGPPGTPGGPPGPQGEPGGVYVAASPPDVAADATLPLWVDISEDGEPTVVPSTGVTTEFIADQAVTAAKIADDTITAAQIAANAVGSSELADNAVDTAAIATGAVTSAKIADGTIATGDLADGAVTPAKLATTGRFTFPTGAANGYGFASGATHLSGTGTPEGVVTAAPGSTWLQTGSTTDVKGWLRWVKATGTGTTGWVAGPEADTGWRDVTSLLDSDWAASPGGLTLRRQGGRVTLRLNPISRVTASGNRSDIAAGTFIVTPSGFAQSGYVSVGVATVNGIPDGHISALAGSGQIGIVCPSGTWTADQVVWGEASYTTADPWPASLPGTAV